MVVLRQEPTLPVMDTAVTAISRVDAIFDELASRKYFDALKHVNGTVEVAIENTERRWVTIRQGDISVSTIPTVSDCVFASNAETFLGVISGRVNVVAASIRGSIAVDGDIGLALSVRRLATDGNDRQ